MHLPPDLLVAATKTIDVKSYWTATCPKGTGDAHAKRFSWPLDADQCFGESDFVRWAKRCVAMRGTPVRIEWRNQSTRALVADGVIWDDGGESEYHDDLPPTMAEALMPADGEMSLGLGGGEVTTSFERAITLLIEKPDVARSALGVIADFIGSFRSGPDEFMMKQLAEHSAAASAAAIKTTLEKILAAEGYEVDEDGEVTAPEDCERDVDSAAATAEDTEEEVEGDDQDDLDEQLDDDQEPDEQLDDDQEPDERLHDDQELDDEQLDDDQDLDEQLDDDQELDGRELDDHEQLSEQELEDDEQFDEQLDEPSQPAAQDNVRLMVRLVEGDAPDDDIVEEDTEVYAEA